MKGIYSEYTSRIIQSICLVRLRVCVSCVRAQLLTEGVGRDSLHRRYFLRSYRYFLRLHICYLYTSIRLLHRLYVTLFLFTRTSRCFATALQRTIRHLSVSNGRFFTSGDIFKEVNLTKGFKGLFKQRYEIPILFFRMVRKNIFNGSGTMVLCIIRFQRPNTLFPGLRRSIRRGFLHPFFILRRVTNGARRTIMTRVMRAIGDPFQIFFLRLTRMTSSFLFNRTISQFYYWSVGVESLVVPSRAGVPSQIEHEQSTYVSDL